MLSVQETETAISGARENAVGKFDEITTVSGDLREPGRRSGLKFGMFSTDAATKSSTAPALKLTPLWLAGGVQPRRYGSSARARSDDFAED